MNRFWRLCSTSAIALALVTVPFEGQAAPDSSSAIAVRGSERDGFTRVVFEGKDKAPEVAVNQTGTSLTLDFSKTATFNLGGANPSSLPRVSGYSQTPAGRVKIDFAQTADVRHFVIGNRLIVDIKDNAAAPKAKVTTPVQDITPASGTANGKEVTPPRKLTSAIEAAPPEKEQNKTKPAETKTPDVKPSDAAGSETKPDDKQAAELAKKLGSGDGHIKVDVAPPENAAGSDAAKASPAEPVLPDHQINLAGTSAFAVAAFEKGNKLWIVIDKPDFVVPPQFEGPNQASFKSFERIPQKDVTIFRTDWPAGYRLSGDGGGMIWKILLNQKDPRYPKHLLVPKFSGPDDKIVTPSLVFKSISFHRAATFDDPDTGDPMIVGLVDAAQDYTGAEQNFAELESYPAVLGFAIAPKVDDVIVNKTDDGAEITRKPGGLALSPEKDILPYRKAPEQTPDADAKSNSEVSRIFDFQNWRTGDKESFENNSRLMMAGLSEQTDQKKAETLIVLGKLMMSYGYAPEAFGYFDLANQYFPDMRTNPEMLAMTGAVQALMGHNQDAFYNFSNPVLDNVEEIKYWKSFTLAGLDDWQQAARILPKDVSVLETYPDEVLWPVGMKLAEVALREGNLPKAKSILDIVEKTKDHHMPLAYSSAFDYLKGEYARQKGEIENARLLWDPLQKGKDDLYRAKSRLAMTMLGYGRKEIPIDKAIDSLEGLRYAWRGDELETAINYNLGKLYLDNNDPVRAMGLMRQAANLIPNSEQGKAISQIMHSTFEGLYSTDKIQKLTPLQALTLYDEFSELVPQGPEGDRLARQLAERLVDVDLLPRAINLLKQQVDSRLSGLEGANVAIRLASLQVQDTNPKDAMETLDKAEKFLEGIPSEIADPKHRAIAMLRARAYAQNGKSKEAAEQLSLLPQDEDVLRLRADIAWKAKKWQDAADALEQVIALENISLTRPLTDPQAKTILDWSVALYLADNRYVLANLRERYSDLMKLTSKAKEFEVVTRPRQNVLLADRTTIENIIGETDIFGNFLQSFKDDQKDQLKGPIPPQGAGRSAAPSAAGVPSPSNVPEQLKSNPSIKTDEVLAD